MSGQPKTVFLRGAETALAEPVAMALLSRGANVALSAADPGLVEKLVACGLPGKILDLGTAEPFATLKTQGHFLDAVVHLHLPDRHTDAPTLLGTADRLRPMLTAALEHMRETESPGIVVNQFLMPTLFADHPLASAMVEARNSITALTRFACVTYGRAGIRTVGLLVGLLDLPSLHALASDRVNAAKTPLGRWIRPDEVAGTIAFLTLDSGYITGQMLVLDGGMTGGLNGV